MEDQIPIAPWSEQPPATPLELLLRAPVGPSTPNCLSLPPPSPGLGLEIGVGRERSTGGRPLFLVTDFTGYVITFKILGALYEHVLSMNLGSWDLLKL